MGGLGFNMHPSRPDLIEDRRAYFAEYGEQRAAAIAERADETVDPEGAPADDDEARVTVTGLSVAVSLAELPAGAKAAMVAATANGWETQAWRSRTHVEATLFKSTTESHNAGDVRFAAKEYRNYFLTARAPAAGRLGFTATWIGEDITDKGDAQKTGGFAGATLYDPAGIETEMYFDYKETRAAVLALGAPLAKKRADMLDWTYNDQGKAMLTPTFTSASKPLLAWIKSHHISPIERSTA